MVDAKAQQFRGAPSGPIGGRKVTATVGGKGTTITKATNTNITLTSTNVPALATLKTTDMVLVAPAASTGPGDANVRPVVAYCTTNAQVVISFNNPTAADVVDFTCAVNLLIFPFNI